ncbi:MULTISPECIES: flagellar hook-basal body complex protein FliE [Sphingomonadaceae]|jgi:flagellar hook-basal body complex protein FliE|uniref:Flagellar hook-basal body complex protein FliE n=1 Tax=Novosphingobium subterraneum TaxID=48936 RepID=A0A0B9A292_9SPHN|nr:MULTISPECIES: flagellar hook-basal body complex protein FliE [Sphingomonadaceae]KHS49472.1 flagellar hook-basal body protein FliE [Novosphingobium subterraneum]MBA4781434.1 flagellar hook-basal body complex protein FliE [Blastomonas sp.]MBU0823581.1 flagellar hook-basal body complex protein FliE [Alphaproteobacteria bacterium]
MSDTSISNVMAIRAEVIARSRALREAQPTAPPGVAPTAPASTFADTLNAVVAKVNETQEQEDVVTEAYERGETTDIATVALIQSRASITFEATLQVRNKLLSAYRDILNMPIG